MKQHLVYVLLVFCNFLMCSSLSVITPFFPPYAISKGVTEEIVGLIISANPIGAFFASLLLGKILNDKKNRFFYMILGLLMQASGMFLFAGTKFIDDKVTLICVGTVARMMSGMGASFFVTPFYAYVPMIYPNAVEKMIGISELAAGTGLFSGPIIGSLLYNLGGYLTPFLVFGGITMVITPIIYIFITKINKNLVVDADSSNQRVPSVIVREVLNYDKDDANAQEKPEENDQNEDDNKIVFICEQQDQPEIEKPLVKQRLGSKHNKQAPNTPKKQQANSPISMRFSRQSQISVLILSRFSHEVIQVSYLRVLRNYAICLTFIVNAVINFVIMYFAPTIAQFLEDSYGASPDNVGYLMSVQALTYTITTIFVTFITGNKVKYLFASMIIIGVSYFFAGPDKLFTSLEPKLYIALIAQGSIGIGIAFGFILSLPTMHDLLLNQYPGQHLICANLASALFNSSMSVGELLGPIVAGFLTKQFGFERGCSITAFFILFVGILYIPVLFEKLNIRKTSPDIQSQHLET